MAVGVGAPMSQEPTGASAVAAAARNASFSAGVPIVTRTPSPGNARTMTPRR